MKVGLIQYNPIIGDFAGNCQRMLSWASKAYNQGCSLIVFPELAIAGYPPLDLLERNIFIDEHDKYVAQFIAALPKVTVVFGALERRNERWGKKLYNSAFVVRDGQVIQKIRKQLLPSYDVFDENRYFQPGRACESEKFIEVEGVQFAVTICEDVWHDETGDYDVSPIQTIKNKCGDSIKLGGVINISASPFQRDKEVLRRNIYSDCAKELNTFFFFCNQVGAQDSLVFDGASMVINDSGDIVSHGHYFAEDLLVFDTSVISSVKTTAPLTVEKSVYDALVLGVKDYVTKCGFKSVVLGLSGGIDSALTAVIAADALGAANVHGVAMPSQYSSDGSLEDAEALAKNIGCGYQIIPIKGLFDVFEESLAPTFIGKEEDVTEQNLQARIRGNLLMAISNKFNHLLLTTGNKSELAVGYCTLYGDMNGGLAVISDVPKELVYKLSHYVNRDKIRIPLNTITKAPSAELKPDQCDQDDLPDYAVLDRILDLHLENGLGLGEIMDHGFEENIVSDILKRVRLNEYKRKQAPMGLKVTSKAFGYGRRFPNVQNFRM
ncbi:MAG: NAD+ synthase [Desulfotalea sp.]